MGRIWMNQVVEAIADLGRQYFERPASKSPVHAAKRLCDDLLSVRGEASGTALGREVVELYESMEDADRFAFLDLLAVDYDCDPQTLTDAAASYAAAPDDATYFALRSAVEAPRQELLRRINMAPEGTATIVHMRELLLTVLRDRPELRRLDADFRHLLESWFNRGFLQFERIEWRTSAAILEKLIAYEAVHEIRGWSDLRRRIADDRRCFAFFHPALTDEPLIFVEVALTGELSSRIEPLLDLPDESEEAAKPNTAIFYSISNCQAGLAGVSFGNLLIKQVVDALSTELPSVRQFATLSPIPGFRRWLTDQVEAEEPELLGIADREALATPGWADNTILRNKMKKTILRLCATYLMSTDDQGRALDPVARFHLGNGASIERINWEGDLSERAIRQSAGIMVNYRYAPSEIVDNHEAYAREGQIATSSRVRSLL